jgi:hypothetical protein
VVAQQCTAAELPLGIAFGDRRVIRFGSRGIQVDGINNPHNHIHASIPNKPLFAVAVSDMLRHFVHCRFPTLATNATLESAGTRYWFASCSGQHDSFTGSNRRLAFHRAL